MLQEFKYKNRIYRAVGTETWTRWTFRCAACCEPVEFASPGSYEPPTSPKRHCRTCAARRRREAKEKREKDVKTRTRVGGK